jgi:hypothetical protein
MLPSALGPAGSRVCANGTGGSLPGAPSGRLPMPEQFRTAAVCSGGLSA